MTSAGSLYYRLILGIGRDALYANHECHQCWRGMQEAHEDKARLELALSSTSREVQEVTAERDSLYFDHRKWGHHAATVDIEVSPPFTALPPAGWVHCSSRLIAALQPPLSRALSRM